MRDAPIAREWQKVKLQQAHEYKRVHLGNVNVASTLLFSGMGLHPPYPANWDEAVDTILRAEADCVAGADLYVLSPHMCDVVIAAAQTLSLEDLAMLGPDDLPSPTGLVVLPHPVIVRTVGGDLGDDRAFSWHTPATMLDMQEGSVRDVDAVRVSSYHDSHGPVRPDSFAEFAQLAQDQGTPLPPLLLDAVRCRQFHYTASEEQLRSHSEYVSGARHVGQSRTEQIEQYGYDENRVVGDYDPGGQIDDPDDTFTLRFLYAFWRLCEQRIADTSRAEVKHAARVLSDRAGVSPEVRVVQLRQAETARSADSEGGGREWKHRWPVRMHKVRQWYPSQQRHRVLLRGPYIKGPADKPLLGGETVRGLTR